MESEILNWLGVLFFALVGVCGCIYGLSPKDYKLYNKSNKHYNDEDCT